MIALLLLPVALAGSDPLVSWSLDDSDGGFSDYGETAQWQWGELSGGPLSGEHLSGWGTGLDRPYLNDSTDYLQLSSFDLSTSARPVLRFAHWYEIDDGGDAGWVEAWDGSAWTAIDPIYDYPTTTGYTGNSNGWHETWFDLRGVSDTAELRFAFSADARISLAGWFIDDVEVLDGDPVPPSITLDVVPEDTQDLDGPYIVEARVQDDLLTPTAEVRWTTGTESGSVAMTEILSGLFHGEIPGQPAGSTVKWRVVATDGTNEASAPEAGPSSFRVYLAAPTDLTGPTGRIVDTAVTLSWTAPETEHEVLGYQIYCDDAAWITTARTSQDTPLCSSTPSFEVSAIYEAGEGERSAPLSLNAYIPEITQFSPDAAWQGDRLRLTLAGTYLLLTEDEVSLDLGPDVDVEEIAVVDADHAVVTVRVGDAAATGLRDLRLVIGDVALDLPGAFTIQDGETRPRLVTIEPDTMVQGRTYTLRVGSNTDLNADVSMDLGEGLVVQDIRVEGSDVYATVGVAWDAPVGERGVEVDDGQRVFDGVDLRVRNAVTTPAGTCSQGGRGGIFGAALALLAAATRSRRARRR